MSGVARIVVGTVLVAGAIGATGALTRTPYTATSERAELRLAWRLPVPRVEECRTPTPEELAERPVHMRQAEICEVEAVAYRLEVQVDDALRHSATVEAAGARGDRPLYVFEEVPVEPGTRRVRIVFERVDAGGGPADDEPAPGSRTPARLVFDRELELGVRDVALVTYDADRGELVLRRSQASR